jgi:hypothetical protein
VNNGWPARSQLFLTLDQLQSELQKVWAGTQIASIGPNCTLAWSSGITTSGVATPSFYMTVLIKASVRDFQGSVSLPLCVSLDEKANPGDPFFLAPVDQVWAPLSIVRDPAGRLLAFGAFGSCYPYQLGRILYATDALLRPGQKPTSEFCQPASGRDELPPTVGYFTDTSAQPYPCPPGSTGSPTYPVYQLAFYGKEVKCQVDYFGYLQVECNAVKKSLLPDNIFVVKGLIEGPVPLPNENIAGYSFSQGPTNLGTITYGATDSTDTSHQASFAWTVGAQSTGHSSKGVGPAWNISFKSGSGSVTGDANSATSSLQKSQRSAINKNGVVGTSVLPVGNIFAAPQTIIATLYKFYDAHGKLISEPAAARRVRR